MSKYAKYTTLECAENGFQYDFCSAFSRPGRMTMHVDQKFHHKSILSFGIPQGMFVWCRLCGDSFEVRQTRCRIGLPSCQYWDRSHRVQQSLIGQGYRQQAFPFAKIHKNGLHAINGTSNLINAHVDDQ